MACKTCNDTGRVLAHRPTIYETDSAEERKDARQMAMRACPDCAQKRQELAERIRQAIADQHDQCACLVWQDCPHALEAIERVLEQEGKLPGGSKKDDTV